MRASQAFNAGSIPVTRSNLSIFRYLTGIEPVRAVEVKNVRWTFFTSTGVDRQSAPKRRQTVRQSRRSSNERQRRAFPLPAPIFQSSDFIILDTVLAPSLMLSLSVTIPKILFCIKINHTFFDDSTLYGNVLNSGGKITAFKILCFAINNPINISLENHKI